MGRVRKDTCPNCHTINPDGWDVCGQCHRKAPPPVVCVNRGGGHPLVLPLNRTEVSHLLHVLHLAVRYNVTLPKEAPDTFWRRQAVLRNKLKALIPE